YRVFQNYRIAGPFDAQAISEIDGFSPDSLVCPESSKGLQSADWRPARAMPDIAAVLKVKPAPAPGAARRAPARLLPAQTALNELRDELRLRDEELGRLRAEM